MSKQERMIAAMFFSVCLLFTSQPLQAEEEHRVEKKVMKVRKNDQIDHNDEEETIPEEVIPIAGGKIRIISKTFLPPPNWLFKLFQNSNTHVDIWGNPEGLDFKRLKDTDSKIKIEGTFPQPVNAGNFPLRGEGNLKHPGGPGTVGAIPVTLYHWSAKVIDEDYKIEIQINNTAIESDDIVCRKSNNPQGRPTIPCRIRTLSTKAISVVLTNKAGNGEVRFPGSADTKKGLTLPASGNWVSFAISGEMESVGRNDAIIEVHKDTEMGSILAEQDLSVLWVRLSIRGTPGAAFSALNDKIARTNPNQLGAASYTGTAGALTMVPGYGYILEIKGGVDPNDFTQEIKMRKVVVGRYSSSFLNNTFTVYSLNPAENTPDDSNPVMLDEDPMHNGVPGGAVFDSDTPGFRIGSARSVAMPLNTMRFSRRNYKSWSEYNGTRCSDDFLWWVRVTGFKQGAMVWIPGTVNNQLQDNAVGNGTTKLDWKE